MNTFKISGYCITGRLTLLVKAFCFAIVTLLDHRIILASSRET